MISGDNPESSGNIVKQNETKSLFIPNQTLKSYGCTNCIWKCYHQCPEGFTEPEQSLEKGYCDELVNFLSMLSEGEDSISAVKEKFHIYTQEVQALSDHKEFHQMIKEYNELKKENIDPDRLTELEMRINAYKIWWMRLTEIVVKGLSRIADRESKKDAVINVEHKISLNQIHQIVDEARKQVDDEQRPGWLKSKVIDGITSPTEEEEEDE